MSVLQVATIAWTTAMVSLLAATAMDFKERIIPNGYVLLIAVAAAAVRFNVDGESAWVSVIVALAIFLILIVLSNLTLLFGGGDAKLIAAVTLLAAPNRVGLLILCIVLAGGFVSCLYLLARALLSASALRGSIAGAIPRATSQRLLESEATKIIAGEPMPYALAVLGGVLTYIIIEAL